MTRRRLWGGFLALVLVLGGAAAWLGLEGFGRIFVPLLTPDWRPELDGPADAPHFAAVDARLERVEVALELLSEGWTQPTDLQFPPGRSDEAVVLERTGTARWWRVSGDARGELLTVDVATVTEQGLLGLAFHPGHADNGRVFLNYVAEGADGDESRIAEWRMDPPLPLSAARGRPVRVLMAVRQPFQNHNAGQLAFGPDGMLYIGFGDGGLRDDPFRHGQNPGTRLGAMLRVDVDRDEGPGWAVPADNPFVGRDGYLPELWAIGLRNPWRYSFDAAGRLWVADVGQDAQEEVHIVEAGDNLGWDLREGFACTEKDPGCAAPGPFVEPVAAYPHEFGAGITGGYVYRGAAVPALRGHYVYADFLSGRLFALPVPEQRSDRPRAVSLGQWPMLPSTFGQDGAGELFVADFAGGKLYGIRAR